ncbi:acetyl-coenzyme A synthetase [Candidatus Pacearchaeota archaeon CG10_big_fil_rev_8_21_14_0_10_32_14]|nr:MAG: acetyl-coenzyme A synthetase [Candidatus Pacearchaeota archaeon CG10_big_fil_rev_8_21_14_0_10_32_14]
MKSYTYVEKSGKNFKPTATAQEVSFAKKDIYAKADKNRIAFWEDLAKEGIDWIEPWENGKAYQQKGNSFAWFKGGKLNLCYNAVDRHLNKPEKSAIVFVPELMHEKKIVISYKELFKMVNNAAAMLKYNGVKKGDVVSIYLPMIPETLAFMLACVRIGAIHGVVFSAFSPDALRTRIKDAGAKVLITSDIYYRRGKKESLKKKANKATRGLRIKKIIIPRAKVGKFLNQDHFNYIQPEVMDAEDLAFILYTSGTTGKPKGVMHTTGGYAVSTYWSAKYIFNMQEGETIWCTADIGWVTGHTYACYGPLLNGATTVLFEGMLDYPTPARYLQIINDNDVSIFYTAPTALRLFAQHGNKYPNKYKLNSLKILGSVGEPIDEKTWLWYYTNIGKKRCPVIDTYWQTETGTIVICSPPGIGPFIPSYAGKAFPGIDYEIADEKGKKLPLEKKGLLVQVPPFSPSLIRGVWGDPKRYKTYFIGKYYLAGDNAFKDAQGNIRILGRSDDVIKVAGHRLSTAEMENAIEGLLGVVEAAVVSKSDALRGKVPIAFVKSRWPMKEEKIVGIVNKKIGPIAKPAKVYFVKDLPKTRSGKIMRRVLKALLANEDPGNIMTLVNPESVKDIGEMLKSPPSPPKK